MLSKRLEEQLLNEDLTYKDAFNALIINIKHKISTTIRNIQRAYS